MRKHWTNEQEQALNQLITKLRNRPNYPQLIKEMLADFVETVLDDFNINDYVVNGSFAELEYSNLYNFMVEWLDGHPNIIWTYNAKQIVKSAIDYDIEPDIDIVYESSNLMSLTEFEKITFGIIHGQIMELEIIDKILNIIHSAD